MSVRAIIIAFCCSLSIAMPALAAWQLDNEKSTLSFISIKKNDIAEVHQFNSLSGEVDQSEIKFVIDLASVDTKIALRDQRMRDFYLRPTNSRKQHLAQN